MSRSLNARKALRRNVAMRQSKPLSFETMEDRRVMAAGDILFDGGTGKLTINGSDFHADTVNVTIDRKGTSATADDVVHGEFVTKAWVDDPLRAVLASIPGYPRTPPPKRRK